MEQTGKYALTKINLIGYMLIFILASGCTTMRPIPNENLPSYVGQLRIGDHVRITTKDGQVLEFKVRQITEKQILGQEDLPLFLGEKEEVAVSNIDKIERREDTSLGKVVIFTINTFYTIVLVGFIVTIF